MEDSCRSDIESQIKNECEIQVRKELIFKLKKKFELEISNDKNILNSKRCEFENAENSLEKSSSSNITINSSSSHIRFKKVSSVNSLNTNKEQTSLSSDINKKQIVPVQTELISKTGPGSCIKMSNVPREIGIGKRLMEYLSKNFGPVVAARVLWVVDTICDTMNVFITFWHKEHCSDFLKSLRKSHPSSISEFFYFDFPYSYHTKSALLYVTRATNKVEDFRAIYPNGQEDIKLVRHYMFSNQITTKKESVFITNDVFYANLIPENCEQTMSAKRKLNNSN